VLTRWRLALCSPLRIPFDSHDSPLTPPLAFLSRMAILSRPSCFFISGSPFLFLLTSPRPRCSSGYLLYNIVFPLALCPRFRFPSCFFPILFCAGGGLETFPCGFLVPDSFRLSARAAFFFSRVFFVRHSSRTPPASRLIQLLLLLGFLKQFGGGLFHISLGLCISLPATASPPTFVFFLLRDFPHFFFRVAGGFKTSVPSSPPSPCFPFPALFPHPNHSTLLRSPPLFNFSLPPFFIFFQASLFASADSQLTLAENTSKGTFFSCPFVLSWTSSASLLIIFNLGSLLPAMTFPVDGRTCTFFHVARVGHFRFFFSSL